MKRRGWMTAMAVVAMAATTAAVAVAAEPAAPAGSGGAAQGRLQWFAPPWFGPGAPMIQWVEDSEGENMEPIRMSDHWIGVECVPARGALAAQLKLPENRGLVVESVVDGSPAAKAELRQHDVIVEAGGKQVGTLQDLISAVDAAKGSELALKVIREGEAREIKVTPEKRPAGIMAPEVAPLAPGGREWQRLRDWFERRGDEGERGRVPGLRYHFFGPGILLPPGEAAAPALPSNLSIAITRTGDEPAKIVVRRGDEKWELTEKELDKLPDDIRPHVEQMLGQGVRLDIKGLMPDLPDAAKLRERVRAPLPRLELEQKLQRMERQIEELRQQFRRLRGLAPSETEELPEPSTAPAAEPAQPADSA
mgnify:CR=1 FL=1